MHQRKPGQPHKGWKKSATKRLVKPMKVIVCGGRDFRSPAQVWRGLDEIHAERPITKLMQGGANGVDTFAKEWAITKPDVVRYVCNAEWTKFGPSAGPIRNKRMLEWGPDLVIAFPGGTGTADMVRQAKAAGVAVHVFLEPSPEVSPDPPCIGKQPSRSAR